MQRTPIAVFCMAALIAVVSAQTPPRITRIEFAPAADSEGGGIDISLLGTGECTYTIDFGDGKSERRTATLPDRLRHSYVADNEYLVVATPQAPCEGVARARIDIRAIARGIWRLSIEPGPATDALEIIATVEGRGSCTVALDFGDGSRQKLEGTLPLKATHTYAKAGAYELRATAADPCRGDIRLSVDVRKELPASSSQPCTMRPGTETGSWKLEAGNWKLETAATVRPQCRDGGLYGVRCS